MRHKLWFVVGAVISVFLAGSPMAQAASAAALSFPSGSYKGSVGWVVIKLTFDGHGGGAAMTCRQGDSGKTQAGPFKFVKVEWAAGQWHAYYPKGSHYDFAIAQGMLTGAYNGRDGTHDGNIVMHSVPDTEPVCK